MIIRTIFFLCSLRRKLIILGGGNTKYSLKLLLLLALGRLWSLISLHPPAVQSFPVAGRPNPSKPGDRRFPQFILDSSHS